MTTNNNVESKKKATNAIEKMMGWLSEPLITGPVILTLLITVAIAAFTVSRLKEYADSCDQLIEAQQEALVIMGWPLNDETKKVVVSREEPKNVN